MRVPSTRRAHRRTDLGKSFKTGFVNDNVGAKAVSGPSQLIPTARHTFGNSNICFAAIALAAQERL